MEKDSKNWKETIKSFNKDIINENTSSTVIGAIIPSDDLSKVKNLKQIVFTVDEAIDQFGFGKFQILITCFAGLAWVCNDFFYKYFI